MKMVLTGGFATLSAWPTMESVNIVAAVPRVISRGQQVLPKGSRLGDDSWRRRHRSVLAIVSGHIPILYLVARQTGRDGSEAVALMLVVLCTLVVAGRAPTRLVGMSAAAIGLLSCSGGLILLSGGRPEAHVHFLLAIGIISLYQSWQVLVLAVSLVLFQLAVMGALRSEAFFTSDSMSSPAAWALTDALFVLGACFIHLTFWSLQESAHARAEQYYRQLYEGEQAVSEYLRASQQMKDELVSVVSHEFRTPLTCILGFARTLADHGPDVPEAMREEFLSRIVGHGERLHRLVENLMVASRVVEPDRKAVSEVRVQLLTAVAELTRAGAAVDTTLEQGELKARMSQDSLYHVLFNLVENGLKFARSGTAPKVGVWRDGDQIVIEVANQCDPIPLADQIRIFDPFVQVDGSTTRGAEGMGMGLAVVRTLVEAHDGRVAVRSDANETVFSVRLVRAAQRGARRYSAEQCATRQPADSTSSRTSTGI